ncbi:MAG TPA: hypothetical protein VFR23_24520 [Jiangellaceae bacterium]|nr:hypothetical protein [Jiangellaceae bacterium]
MIYVHVIEHASCAKPWVAVITGANPRFGFARRFVRPRHDYRDSGKTWRRTVGIKSCYLLEEGWVCEFFEQRNGYDKPRDCKRYFARVTQDGLDKLDEHEVIRCLRKRR